MIIDENIKKLIEQKIAEIEKEYQQTQGLILTEDDLKCVLYGKLMQIFELSNSKETRDQHNIYATFVHTEVSWYDQNNKLTKRPDITVLEPENLSILQRDDHKLELPSKGCSFSGDAIIFELKFIRNKAGITQRTLNPIKKDYEKIQKLFEKLRDLKASNNVFCYFVIFNKTNIKCREFDIFIERNGQGESYKIIYATGNVAFPNRQQK